MSLAVTEQQLVDIVKKSAAHLEKNGSDSPRLDAEILIATSLGLSRLELYLQFDRPLDEDELNGIRDLVRRRGNGEPVAYITGAKEFYGRLFKVTPDTLIPRPETELLIERALLWIRGQGKQVKVADVGTGSGCIAITLAAECEGIQVVATDVSEAALAVARQNAETLGVNGRIQFVHTDLLTEVGEIDAVISNPPYITTDEMAELPKSVCFEPASALEGGADGLDIYRRLCKSLPKAVKYVGLEVDSSRAGQVAKLLEEAGEVSIHRDLAGRDRVVEVVCGRGIRT